VSYLLGFLQIIFETILSTIIGNNKRDIAITIPLLNQTKNVENMKKQNTKKGPVQWSFKYKETSSFDENIRELCTHLDIRNISFTSFETNKEGKYIIKSVSWTGSFSYIKSKLKDSFLYINTSLQEFSNSEESLETIIITLKKALLIIEEHLLTSNPFDKISLDMSNTIALKFYNGKEVKGGVHINECDTLSKEIVDEIYQHLDIRTRHLNRLMKQIQIELLKLELNPLMKKIKREEENNVKEMQLLEVWLGLKQMGFLDHLDKTEHNLNRKVFFELFGLTDRNYKTRHRDIKNRTAYKALFLREMIKKMQKGL
jgi:hypothetical protein